MVIAPRCVSSFWSPRRRLTDNDSHMKFVKAEHAPPRGMPTKKTDQICEHGQNCAVLVQDQVCSPVRRTRRCRSITATDRLHAIGFGFVETHFQDALESAFLKMGEISSLLFARRVHASRIANSTSARFTSSKIFRSSLTMFAAAIACAKPSCASSASAHAKRARLRSVSARVWSSALGGETGTRGNWTQRTHGFLFGPRPGG